MSNYDLMWHFPYANHGARVGFNGNGIDQFGDNPYGNLAREVIQNSLDAGNGGEVVVEFSLFSTDPSEILGYSTLYKYFKDWLDQSKISGSEASKDEEKKFFSKGLQLLTPGVVPMGWLRISDFNTKGMAGCSDESNHETPWFAFTKGTGQNEKNDSSGGSKGLGKNAIFANSLIRTIFVSTFADTGEKGTAGIAKLDSMTVNDGSANPDWTQGIGFCVQNNQTSINQNLPLLDTVQFDPDFCRTEYGTDVYVPCFAYDPDWYKTVLGEAILSFLPAILRGQLRVKINSNSGSSFFTEEVSKDNLPTAIRNVNFFESNSRAREALSYYNALTSTNSIVTKYDSKPGFEMELHALIDNANPTYKVMVYRNAKMKIKSYNPDSNVDYSAVLLITGDEICSRLRSIEDATHSKWSKKRASLTKYTSDQISEALDAVNDFLNEKISNLGLDDSSDSTDMAWAKVHMQGDDAGAGLTSEKKEEDGLPTDNVEISDEKIKELKPRYPAGNVPDDGGDASGYEEKPGKEGEPGFDISRPDGRGNGGGGVLHPGIKDTAGEGTDPVLAIVEIATAECKMPAKDPRNGLFRLIFSCKKTGQDVCVHVSKLGSTGLCEETQIIGAMYQGQTLKTSGNSFMMEQIEKDKQYCVDLKLDEHENFVWEVKVNAGEKI
jgi:hypothetical protein